VRFVLLLFWAMQKFEFMKSRREQPMTERFNWKVFFLAISFFFALGVVAYSQGTTGTFTGTVTDQSGAVVPGATITITNQATGVKYNLTSNDRGVYYVTSVQPGQYSFTVKKQGFQTYSTQNVEMSVDYTQRLDIKLTVGSETTTVTVEAAAPLVSTEAGRLSDVVQGSTISSMPLNGRNIYELMQLAPGAIKSSQVDFENGQGTNINGTRENFNGFLLDGMSAKGLSGGTIATPPPDFVGEFRIQTNNFDAQYSNSAGSITDVSTKSGSNEWHGDAFEFVRNDKLNSRNFFDGADKSHFRLNEFGGTVGGPIKHDKVFIFGGAELERFRYASPAQVFTETAAFHDAVISTIPNSAAALMYKTFPNPVATSDLTSVGDYIANNSDFGDSSYYLDPCTMSTGLGAGAGSLVNGTVPWGNPQTFANNMASLIGVTNAENAAITQDINANCPGMFTAPGTPGADMAGTLSRSSMMAGFVNASGLTRSAGNFYTGSKWTVKGDYQGDTNRLSAKFYYDQNKDPNPTPITDIRGQRNPFNINDMSDSLSFVHTFSPTMLNEADAGYSRDSFVARPLGDQYGVPQLSFDTGEPQFGSYNGYPQVFIENIFNFKDMLTLVKGKHSLKVGAELTRNQENSEFDVGRPSYYFFDPLYFAGDFPYWEAAGVNPELTATGGTGSPHIDTNIRAFRNYELGFFIQDDFKISPKLTLNMGLRWDYFSPHTEKYGKATAFVTPSTGLASINCQAFAGTSCVAPEGDTQTPNGGFTSASGLFGSHYNNWGPRIGFAYDPWGNGKDSIRGGFAIQYESSFWNALSNSRWNLPFYSFNIACPYCGYYAYPTYGPTDSSGAPTGGAWVPNGVAPTFSGDTSGTIGSGPTGLGFAGNLMGWLPNNPNLAYLTGIPDSNYRLPYVMNYFLSVQHQFNRSTVLTVNGVSTLSRHLYWAENPNRVVGGYNRAGVTDPCTGTFVPGTPAVNPCFGYMRTWETSVNSSYFGLQAELVRRMSHGLAFTSSYTWSHTLDYRSTWHGGTTGGSATDNNGRGEAGYSSDPTRVYLEKGNSLFDVRQRWVSSIQWEMPWRKDMQGVSGKFLGGWTVNTIVALQSGLPFTVGASSDYNGDGIRSDRPNVNLSSDQLYFSPSDILSTGGLTAMAQLKANGAFPKPSCTVAGDASCNGNLGRNTFRSPGLAETDLSLFKRIPLGANESRYIQFRGEIFNLFNHTNLDPPNANLSSGSFGRALTAQDPREIQLALKLFF
jgi:Carboxypeptidase regulatory-like domain